jgi:hypothetical protein
VADGFAFAEFVEVRLNVVGRDGEVLLKEAEEVGLGLGLGICGLAGVVLQGEEFDAIAGREDEAFADAGLVKEGAGGVGKTGGGYGEALADLDGRGVVVDTEEDEVHGVVNLWTAENWLAAQTVRTTRKTKLER